MHSTVVSIVIPTRDRFAALERTLAEIGERAAEVPGLEVIVVDDGSSAAVAPPPDPPGLRVERLRQPPCGPAAARNLGIRRANGDRVLLLGDDTRPAAACLARHAAASDGLQGRIEWDPSRPITEVMRFLAPAGPQFWFAGLRDGDAIPFTAVLGSNYSAPRAWFLAEPFDETFADAAFEDTELAWRFRGRGYPSRYGADALAWHDHVYTDIGPFLDRQRRAGFFARRAAARHPALLWWALIRPLAIHGIKAILPTRRAEPERSWDRSARRAYLRGFFGAYGRTSTNPESA